MLIDIVTAGLHSSLDVPRIFTYLQPNRATQPMSLAKEMAFFSPMSRVLTYIIYVFLKTSSQQNKYL